MANEGKKRNLGRGLSALLGEDGGAEVATEGPHEIRRLPVEFLTPGRFQPRQTVDDEPLRELAQSIADKGVLQPLLVRADPDNPDRYEIIAGERRWRAAQLAQVHEVPVIVKELEDSEALEIALIENLQREDLSALDEAQGYQRLKEEFAYTQAELAASLGKSRSHVANTLRLLNLPGPVKSMIAQGALTAGHARALLNAEDPAALARAVARRGLNVRQTEKLVQKEQHPARAPRREPEKDADTVALEHELANMLGLKIGITFRGDSGTMTIHYQSLEQLDDVLFRLSQGALGTFRLNLEGADGSGKFGKPEAAETVDELLDAQSDPDSEAATMEAADQAMEFFSEDGQSPSFADTSAAIAEILADGGKNRGILPAERDRDYAATSVAIDEILANADDYDATAIDEISARVDDLDTAQTTDADAFATADDADVDDADTGDANSAEGADGFGDFSPDPDAADATNDEEFSPEANEIDAMRAAADVSDDVGAIDDADADADTGADTGAEISGDDEEISPDADAIDAMLADADVSDDGSAPTDGDGESEEDFPDAELSEADAAALLAGIAEGLGLDDLPTDGTRTGDLSADDFLIDEEDDPLNPKDQTNEE